MSTVIDRRLQGKDKSAVNRDRFLKRYKGKIKEAVARSIKGRSITDINKGGDVSVPVKDIREPNFGHSHDGVWETVVPGNTRHAKGDTYRRPRQNGGGSGAGNSDDPLDDDFVFTLSKDEFIEYFFEDLELPDMVKKQLKDSTSFKNQRAGYKTSGASTSIHILKTLTGALGRRISAGGKSSKRLVEALKELETVEDEDKRLALVEEIARLKTKLSNIPWIDTFDLRYSNTIQVKKPECKAVMFCILDVSGSMDEAKKDMAKRFFTLLYLFLLKSYEKIELVFIRHHTEAQEVSEQDFFYSQESGGTIVSSALNLLADICKERYHSDDYNIYVAQASDGDNWESDSKKCYNIMLEDILPLVQYFAYIEITERVTQNLWDHYAKIEEVSDNFAMEMIAEAADIYPVFRELFKKNRD